MSSTEVGVNEQLKQDIEFLLGFVHPFDKEPLKKMIPTYYHSMTYEGDMKIKERIDEIKKRIAPQAEQTVEEIIDEIKRQADFIKMLLPKINGKNNDE